MSKTLGEENEELKTRVKELEDQLEALRSVKKSVKNEIVHEKGDLEVAEYLRYGRQLILSDFGISGQIKIKNTSILIVGAGGLGAPAAIYLASSGVGRLGIIDYDKVEISNLHRQIIHDESRIGISKSQSAKMTIEGLNSFCECIAYDILLDSSNALDIIKKYDIVIDATDNVATRYLLNDACVITGKPLVSGSALRMDGQLTVYNYQGGPCYRCLFPNPPPPETVLNCADGGVMGVVPGIIGCLQALQAIKIAANINDDGNVHSLLLFSATSNPLFRSIKLRSKKPDCAMCGENPTIKTLQDYVQFCGSGPLDKSPSVNLIKEERRVDPKEYNEIRLNEMPHLLLDVRESVQFNICNLPGSLNIPLKELPNRVEEVQRSLSFKDMPGNDSQYAVNLLKDTIQGDVKDVRGGLYQWALDVDQNFPIY